MGYPEIMRDVLEEVKGEETTRRRKELANRHIIDHVTGFHNERYFYLMLDERIKRARRHDKCLSLIVMEAGCIGKDDNSARNPDEHKLLKLTSDVITSCIKCNLDIPLR